MLNTKPKAIAIATILNDKICVEKKDKYKDLTVPELI